jgi:hypothetical protein
VKVGVADGTGVFVGGIGVLLGAAVGVTGVWVGVTGVCVGVTGVLVGVTGVAVGGGDPCDAAMSRARFQPSGDPSPVTGSQPTEQE